MPIDDEWRSPGWVTGDLRYSWNTNATTTNTNYTNYSWSTTNWAYTTSSSSTINWLQEGDIVRPVTEVLSPENAVIEVEDRQRQREVARTAARDRADELLRSMLSDDQRESYRLTGEFIVIGSAGGVYRVRRGNSGNIDWLQADGSVGGRLCAHPDMCGGWLPDQDVALAQLLALTTDEAAFVRVANVHSGQRPRVMVRG